MEKYINYVLQAIINDVNHFTTIYHNYEYLTYIFVWFFWCAWILIKYSLLTCPFWILTNRCLNPIMQVLHRQIINLVPKKK